MEQASATGGVKPADSASQASETSQTAQDYIASQLSLEADAREALPYQFDTCTKPLGPLRQSVYACLTCNPPPASKYQQFTPAGVCYSCSISCHGEHNLVELFTKRDFVCDCGTTRMSNIGTPCSLRLNAETSRKGGVVGEEARIGNKYNQNFQGKFCGCGGEYDPEREKGTMFQCLGLGTVEDGGCGEDWWHPECLLELPRSRAAVEPATDGNGSLEMAKEEPEDADGELAANEEHHHTDELPLPPGFPHEDDFDHLICYKCVNAFPWIKQYANSDGFLSAKSAEAAKANVEAYAANGALPQMNGDGGSVAAEPSDAMSASKKRKAEDHPDDSQNSKKARPDYVPETTTTTPRDSHTNSNNTPPPKHTLLPPAPTGNTALFPREDFRDHLCKCPTCFPLLARHRPLLEEEESYEPPLSESSVADDNDGRRSVNSGSLLDRGEAALNNMDRVRAIEGVMAYNHVRDKVKDFLKPFAESGQVVSAEEVKAYFARLRGDEAAGKAGVANGNDKGGGGEQDFRREQGGY